MLEKKLRELASIRIDALYDQFINESDADILLQEIKSKRLEESDIEKITKLIQDNEDCFKSNSANKAIDAVRQIFLINPVLID